MQDLRSKKIKLLDFLFNTITKSKYLRDKLKIFCDRGISSIAGFKFSYISSENGEYEFINFLGNLYRNKKFIFFDVGAHHGTYTDAILEYKSILNYEGHLFEPTHSSFEILRNKYSNLSNLNLNNKALSNFNGVSKFMVYPDSPTRNGLIGVGKELSFHVEEISCEVMRGDKYCEEMGIESIDLLKIDAEGHDFFVLEGFSELIANRKINIIQFEYTFKHSDMRISLRQYYEFFSKYGYKIGPLRKYGVNFYEDFDSRSNEYCYGPNYIAVKLDLVQTFSAFKKP